jgi:hypothetical protein
MMYCKRVFRSLPLFEGMERPEVMNAERTPHMQSIRWFCNKHLRKADGAAVAKVDRVRGLKPLTTNWHNIKCHKVITREVLWISLQETILNFK